QAKKQSTNDKYVAISSSDFKDEIDAHLAKAIFVNNLPFTIVQNKSFEAFVSKLNPSYKLPSRQYLSTTLLDNEYDRIQKQANKLISECNSLSIILDGWTNIKNNAVINIIVCTPTPIFYRSIDSGVESHKGDYLFNLVDKIVQELGPKKVSSVVTMRLI
ncbi:uncharacterized protein B4U79_18821, partial [Dinothrombium tinctorium]